MPTHPSRTRRLAVLAALAALLLVGRVTAARAATLITVDEFGNGLITLPSGTVYLSGVLSPDPGPGGVDSALSYDLLSPPSLESGDVLATYDGRILQLFRFNAADTGYYSYPASLVFYSNNLDGMDTPANTATPPAEFYENVVSLNLTGTSPFADILYTPSAGQPGYIDGFDVSYSFNVATPEPSAALLVLPGFGLILVARRRRRRS